MNAKVVYRDFGLQSLMKRIGELSGTRIRVGLVGPKAGELSADGRHTHAEVGMINMYGSDDGTIPARDFLREPFNRGRAAVARILKAGLQRILNGERPVPAMDWVGYQLAEIVRTAMARSKGIGAANAESTVRRKGFNHPLFETAGLIEAISHQVVKMFGDVLDAGAAVGDYESFTATPGEGDGGGED